MRQPGLDVGIRNSSSQQQDVTASFDWSRVGEPCAADFKVRQLLLCSALLALRAWSVRTVCFWLEFGAAHCARTLVCMCAGRSAWRKGMRWWA